MSDDPIEESEHDAAERWAAFCDHIKATGQQIMGEGFPRGALERAEGIRHLARMVTLGLNLYLEYDDPDFPRFLRHNDDITQWGGNNPDNTYLYARIDGGSTYKLYGNASTTSGFIVSLRDGFMHQGDEGVSDLSSEDIDTDDTGSFELLISAEPQSGNWLPMLPNATQIGIRVYFDAWSTQPPPVFHIVKVGNEGLAPGPVTPHGVGAGLDAAAEWIDANLVYWNGWLKQRLPFLPVNTISPPMQVAGGSNEVITYAGGRLDLPKGDAVILTVEPLRADYVGLVYYTQSWFETGDLANRNVSLNQNQLHTDSDGRIRIVISGEDPGHANWLDTEGRTTGLLVMRTINGDTQPTVSASVTPVASLRASLPADTRWLSSEERRRQIQDRREHLESRWHR